MSVYNLQVHLLQSNYYLILWYYVYGNVIISIIIILSRINICMSKFLHVLYVLIYQNLLSIRLCIFLYTSMIILQNINGYTEEKNRSFYKRHFSIYNTMYLKLFLLYHLSKYFVITQHRSIFLDLIS